MVSYDLQFVRDLTTVMLLLGTRRIMDRYDFGGWFNIDFQRLAHVFDILTQMKSSWSLIFIQSLLWKFSNHVYPDRASLLRFCFQFDAYLSRISSFLLKSTLKSRSMCFTTTSSG